MIGFSWGNRTVLLFAGILALCGLTACQKSQPQAEAPLEVKVVMVHAEDVPVYQQWIGTLDGYPNAQIRAQVAGYLIRQDYTEGGVVKQGDLLFEVDPRPFQAALDQASGKLAQDEAQRGLMELNVNRYTPLASEKAISQEELDNARQAKLMADAAVKADEAAVESARLNLGFCKITSPIDGIAGTAQAQIGDLVGPSSAVLTTVSTLDPIRAYFSISEQTYLAFQRLHTNEVDRDAFHSEMELQLLLSDGSTYPSPGKWLFTGRQVDVNTGTLQVAGVFPNPSFVLRPGQYAQIRAKTDTRHGVMLVPQRAVTELQGTYRVVTVGVSNTAHIQPVRIGEQIGGNWVIEQGLAPNDRVVAEGVQKVKEGMTLNPQPFQPQTTNNAAPVAKE